MSTYSNSAREVEMPDGNVVVLHKAPTGGANTTSNIKKFKYDDNGHVTESTAADAEDLNLSGYSTPTTGTTAIGTSDDVQTAIGKLDHQSHIDQTNILYTLKRTGENYLPVTSGTVNNGYIMKLEPVNIKAGNYTFSFKAASGFSGNYQIDLYQADGTTKQTVQGSVSSSVVKNIVVTNDIYYVTLYFSGAVTASEIMLCHEERRNVDDSFVDYTLPNYDLTRLESEDRASLAEVVDSGAKNLINCSVDNIKSLNSTSTYSWNGNTVTAYGRTATVNSDGTITVAAGTGSAEFWLKVANYTYASGVSYVLSGCPANGSTTTYYMESDNLNLRDLGSGVVINSATTDELYVVVKTTGSTPALTFKPMLCTNAAFGVSNKFVPYDTRQWQYVEKSFASTAADTYEYTGVSFVVPANQIYEFIIADRKESSNISTGILVADNKTDVLTTLTKSIIAENTMTYSGRDRGLWAREVSGMTMKYNMDNPYYVWIKRNGTEANTIVLAYRRIY